MGPHQLQHAFFTSLMHVQYWYIAWRWRFLRCQNQLLGEQKSILPIIRFANDYLSRVFRFPSVLFSTSFQEPLNIFSWGRLLIDLVLFHCWQYFLIKMLTFANLLQLCSRPRWGSLYSAPLPPPPPPPPPQKTPDFIYVHLKFMKSSSAMKSWDTCCLNAFSGHANMSIHVWASRGAIAKMCCWISVVMHGNKLNSCIPGYTNVHGNKLWIPVYLDIQMQQFLFKYLYLHEKEFVTPTPLVWRPDTWHPDYAILDPPPPPPTPHPPFPRAGAYG